MRRSVAVLSGNCAIVGARIGKKDRDRVYEDQASSDGAAVGRSCAHAFSDRTLLLHLLVFSVIGVLIALVKRTPKNA